MKNAPTEYNSKSAPEQGHDTKQTPTLIKVSGSMVVVLAWLPAFFAWWLL